MFGPNKLAQLYPHLNLSRTIPPSAKAPEPSKTFSKPVPVEKRSISIERPKRCRTPQPPVERPETPVQTKEPVTPKKVTIEEPVKEEVREPSPAKVETTEKTVIKRPNRVKTEPKPVPVRESCIPQKGEKGLQRKYTPEQRKQMYLDRLSRKSVKNAEKEVEAVTRVLDDVGGTVDGLVKAEKAIRGQLRLINYAKYFTTSSNIEQDEHSESETSEE